MRIKGEPHDLALGLACGFFSGILPIIPFHTVLAITLAILLKSSKITAALGTWISNPLNWYFLYYANYKVGVWVLGLSAERCPITSILTAIHNNETGMVIFHKIMSSGGVMISAFMLGGVIMGIAVAIPSYFIFFRVFKYIRVWRENRKVQRQLLNNNQQKSERISTP